MKVRDINTTTLAFMGDAVYEVYVRKRVIGSGEPGADRLHHMAVRYVNASAQAGAIKAMLDDLSHEERSLVRRARNRRPATKAKNADMMTYKWATAFEALVGYLYLVEDTDRMEEVIARAMREIDGEEKSKK
ncbi:MAG: Mini-ribonuclease 3 [Anaerovoracaceae bacterium]|jgi:ribonuclease-3 family protein